MKVRFVKKRVGDDVFFVRKIKRHWWSRYKFWFYHGKEARYDYVGGVFYQRMEQNYDTPCKLNIDAPNVVTV